MVRRWFGVRASKEIGEVVLSVVSGRLFITASASHMNVRSTSSFSWRPFFSRSAERTLRTVLICLSHTPPMWLAVGALNLNSIQSQFILRRLDLILSWCISPRASLSSRLAPMKFVPWSARSWRIGPRLQTNRRSAFRKESVSIVLQTSKWTDLEAMQVKITPYRLSSLRPSLTYLGPKKSTPQ